MTVACDNCSPLNDSITASSTRRPPVDEMETTWPTKIASDRHTASHGAPGVEHEQLSALPGDDNAAPRISVTRRRRIVAAIVATFPLDT
jgi:hypothetical protein